MSHVKLIVSSPITAPKLWEWLSYSVRPAQGERGETARDHLPRIWCPGCRWGCCHLAPYSGSSPTRRSTSSPREETRALGLRATAWPASRRRTTGGGWLMSATAAALISSSADSWPPGRACTASLPTKLSSTPAIIRTRQTLCRTLNKAMVSTTFRLRYYAIRRPFDWVRRTAVESKSIHSCNHRLIECRIFAPPEIPPKVRIFGNDILWRFAPPPSPGHAPEIPPSLSAHIETKRHNSRLPLHGTPRSLNMV